MFDQPTKTNLPPLGEVEYIQSFLPTSEDIRGRSVLEVQKIEDLQSNKLGVLDWGESCGTCDNFLEECAGHQGHLELPIPVYRIFFVKRTIDILNSICFYCQKLRIPKTHPNYKWIRNMEPSVRLEYVLKYSRTYKRCGKEMVDEEENDAEDRKENLDEFDFEACVHDRTTCGKPYINFLAEDRDSAFIKAVVPLEVKDHVKFSKNRFWKPFEISPQDVFDCLRVLDKETLYMLGCDQWNPPEATMWEVLPIPSQNTRPCHTFAGIGTQKKRIYNAWTKLLKNIVTASIFLKSSLVQSSEKINICMYSMHDIVSYDHRVCFRHAYLDKAKRDAMKKKLKDAQKRTVFGIVESAWRNLNKQIAAFHSFRHKKYTNNGSTYGKPLENIEERYKYQKAGRFRGNIIARRVNNAMRGVLEGDIMEPPDIIQIPRQEAMSLSLKVYVRPYNMHLAHKWVLNGPYVYPGANYVTLKDGREINLAYYENRRDIDLRDVLFVRRHLLDGDYVMGNRQPTLHRLSMLTFRIKVVDGFVIRLHYACFTPLGADCDGDEVNLHVPQTLEAIAELSVLSTVENLIMKDGVVWIKFIQNAVVSAHLITANDLFLTKDEVSTVISDLQEEVFANIPASTNIGEETGEPVWSGRSIFSLLLPQDFTMTYKIEDGEDIVIKSGQLISGQLNDKSLNGVGGIIDHMYRDYSDKGVTMHFIHQAYILLQRFLDIHGLSIGYYDCAIDYQDIDRHAHQKRVDAISEFDNTLEEIMTRIDVGKENISRMKTYADTFPEHTPISSQVMVETNLRTHIDKANQFIGQAVNDYHNHIDRTGQNGLLHLIKSGAKGSTNVVNQMCGIVGQIYVLFRRHENVSSHFRRGADTMEAFGFVEDNYSTGVSLKGFIAEAPATCVSVINKTKGTGEGGYTTRKLSNCMMGVVTDYLGRAVDTNGRVIWELYGNDGYDPQSMTTCSLRVLNCLEYDIPKMYAVFADIKQVLRYSSYVSKQEWDNAISKRISKIDAKWLKGLEYFESVNEGSTILDQSQPLEMCMHPRTLNVWKVIKRNPDTVFNLVSETTDMVRLRNRIQEMMMRFTDALNVGSVRSPFSFSHLFERCYTKFLLSKESKVDMTPLDYRIFATSFWLRLSQEKLVSPSNLTLKCLFFDWFSTKYLITTWRFGWREMNWLALEIVRLLGKALLPPGSSVGSEAAQGFGEPFVQMALKTPHFMGKFPTTGSGTKRIGKMVDGQFSNPTMNVVLNKSCETKEQATIFGLSLVRCYLIDVCSTYPTYTLYEFDAERRKKCLIRIEIDKEKAVNRLVSVRSIVTNLCARGNLSVDYFRTSFSTDVTWHIYIDIPFSSETWSYARNVLGKATPDEIIADVIVYNIYRSVVVHGVTKIENFIPEQVEINTLAGKEHRWSITTLGSDLSHVLRLPEVDVKRTSTNDCSEMCTVFGIHAARKSLENEFISVMNGLTEERHIKLIARMMASGLVIKGMKIKQVGRNIPPLQRAAYEQGPKQMVEYCSAGEKDYAQTICGAALSNRPINVGSAYNTTLFRKVDVVQSRVAAASMEALPTNICDYVFSPKIDGLAMKLLFSHNRARTKNFCNIYTRDEKIFSVPSSDLPKDIFEGTELSGELVLLPNTENTYCFVVYDCSLAFGNKSSVLRYDQRIEIAREIVYRLGTNNMNSPLEKAKNYTPIEMHANSLGALPSCVKGNVSSCMFEPGNLPFYITVKPLFAKESLQYFNDHYLSTFLFPVDAGQAYIFTSLSLPIYPFRMKRESIFKLKSRGKLSGSVSVYDGNTIDVEITLSDDTVRNTKLPLEEPFCRNTGDICLWGRGRQLFGKIWKGAYFVLDTSENPVYECRWNRKTLQWEPFLLRRKAANTMETILATVQNIKEDLQLSEI
jgi:DNA-directed RNA polymerase beta' subunit